MRSVRTSLRRLARPTRWVHAHGPVEVYDDAARLHAVVSRLTALHESGRDHPGAVTDAPADYIRSQLKGIVGLRLPITRLEGKRKLSQNRPEADRVAVAEGLAQSERDADRAVAGMMRDGKT